MTRNLVTFAGLLSAGAFLTAPAFAAETITRAVIPAEHEDALKVPMPSVFHVEYTELDGPVFADAGGKTLYYWPNATMRNGVTGDSKNESACTDKVLTHTAGLMSPFPPGLELPELKTRKSCLQVWPAAYAADDAKPVGAFTIITRKDGKKQWAYDQHVLYTYDADKAPGDVNGASTRGRMGEGASPRVVAQVPSEIPPGFRIVSTALGRQLLNNKNYSVYMSDRDGVNKSNCDANCATTWVPVVAAVSAQPRGDWTLFERTPGVRQWAFRKKPLYTYALDGGIHGMDGSDVPGWRNVYTQKAPQPPAAFTLQDSIKGVVLADAKARTIYYYTCGDDSADQLTCDEVDSPPVYRLAICGGGKVDRCLHEYPYLTANAGDKSLSRSWQVLTINPQTGHLAQAGDAGTLRVWAYRGRPLYTFAHDEVPGDIFGHGNGEFEGARNGFRAFFVREEFTRQ